MIKLLLAVTAALFLALGIAQLLREDPGYLLVDVGGWQVQTSVAVGIFSLLVGFFLLYWLLRFLIRVWKAPRQAKEAAVRYRQRRSQRLLGSGLHHLFEGHWKKAEVYLLKGIQYNPLSPLYYVAAAQAAQRLGPNARHHYDYYFQYADQQLAVTETLPVKLTQAQFYLDAGKPSQARDILLKLLREHPHQPRALELLALSYQALGDWKKLHELLPEVGKYALLSETQHRQLQVQTYSALLKEAAQHNQLDELHAVWKKIPQALHQDETLLIEYAGQLRDLGAATEAEALLRKALERQWSDKLVVGYGEIGRGNMTEQFATAEGWLKKQDKNSYLLLTCGRLAKRAQQLDKARTYLQQSIAALPTPDALQELGEILQESGDLQGALQCYQTALRLLSGRVEAKEASAVLSLGTTGSQALVPGSRGSVTLTKQSDDGQGSAKPSLVAPGGVEAADVPAAEQAPVEERIAQSTRSAAS